MLEERIKEAEGRDVDLSADANARHKAVNDYSIVVQEFFQLHTKDFLDSIGKDLLGIKHYWVCYEFAKGHGQIHAHLLAITDDANNISKQLHQHCGNKDQQAAILNKWVTEKLDMTAIHPATDDNGNLIRDKVAIPEGTAKPSTDTCSKHLCEVGDFVVDKIDLVNVTQMHQCSDYCLRKMKTHNEQE